MDLELLNLNDMNGLDRKINIIGIFEDILNDVKTKEDQFVCTSLIRYFKYSSNSIGILRRSFINFIKAKKLVTDKHFEKTWRNTVPFKENSDRIKALEQYIEYLKVKLKQK